eukprot:Nitzschia sp. Nitz4//scaffold111_size72815//30009//30671//NITZ4_005787-RA/size72815-processed-gene-0.34-mRNA-1//-1//CDS//3329533171//9116//frame0
MTTDQDSINMPPPGIGASKKTTTSLSTAPDRHMNDSTLPIAKTSVAGTAVNPRTQHRKAPAVNPRHRFGLHDWKRLLMVSNDLAQRKGQPIRRDIPKEEIRQHCKPHDGWIILRGNVYNIGPYLAYHPGGVTILQKVLGKDATSMFDKYHRWVNIEGLIGPLMLGTVAASPTPNPFSVVPPKESHLTNAPRVSAKVASGSALLANQDSEDDDVEDELLNF